MKFKRSLGLMLALIMALSLLPATVFTVSAKSLGEYRYYDTSSGSFKTDLSSSLTVITDGTVSWTGGNTYVANGTVTIPNRVNVSGNVSLILADEAELSIKGGICIGSGATLTVYAQTDDAEKMGRLTVSDVEASNAGIGGNFASAGGNIIIHGGYFDVRGGSYSAGIGSGESDKESIDVYLYDVFSEASFGDITIYGGILYITGGMDGAAIGTGWVSSCGNINIVGGLIKATAGQYASAIGAGCDCLSVGTVTYPAGTEPYSAGGSVYVGFIPDVGVGAECLTSGYRDAYRKTEDGPYYSSITFTEDTLIGDADALALWRESGDGFLPALGHNWESYEIEGNVHRCRRCGEKTYDPHIDEDSDGHCDLCGNYTYLCYDESAEKMTLEAVDSYVEFYNGETKVYGGCYLVDDDFTVEDRIVIVGDVHLILCNGKTLTAKKGITVDPRGELHIHAQSDDKDIMGKLTINEVENGYAGIGGEPEMIAGDIYLHGGNFSIKPGDFAPAIGNATNGKKEIESGPFTDPVTKYILKSADECNPIGIYGGVYSLQGGGWGGAVIGAGYELSSCGDITITGGNFESMALAPSRESPAIGCVRHGRCGNITISGGVFPEIVCGLESPAIGAASLDSVCKNITINGGTFVGLHGGWGAAAIGSGDGSGNACGNITINGGTIFAQGGYYACGIGYGNTGNCGSVTINGGVIKAVGNDCPGIGSKSAVSYGEGVYHNEADNTSFVNCDFIPEKSAICEENGTRPYWYNRIDGKYYTDFPLTEDTLIGGADEFAAWKNNAGFIAAPGHDYSGKTERASDTEIRHYCVRCSDYITITYFETKEPTCLLDGYTGYYQDSQSGLYFSDENGKYPIGDADALEAWKSTGDGFLERLGHSYTGNVEGIGGTEFRHFCIRCDEYFTETRFAGKDATCTEDGYKGYSHSSLTGLYYLDTNCTEEIGDNAALDAWLISEHHVIPALGHDAEFVDTENHFCTRCKETLPHEDADDDGFCDGCGATMYYEYNESAKEFEHLCAPSDATVLTGTLDTSANYDADWYIVRGNASAQDLIKISASGEKTIRIILENGSNLDAKKGIVAGDDVIFYSSTLDEEKMGKVTVTSPDDNYPAIGTHSVYGDAQITIDGGNYLLTGGRYAAAIGSGYKFIAYITINGGVFDLTGGYEAAAIGGGVASLGGRIVINGGNFKRIYGGYYAPAIGYGCGSSAKDDANITINGGHFERTMGRKDSAAIGSSSGGACGDITINGGYFFSVIGDFDSSVYDSDRSTGAAAIGAGYEGSCGNINITGGEFHAVSSRENGAGIGAGTGSNFANSVCGDITISGGLFAEVAGGEYASAIGCGSRYSSCGIIRITGGAINACGGGVVDFHPTNTTAIGIGAKGVNLGKGLEALDVTDLLPGTKIDADKGIDGFAGHNIVLIYPRAIPSNTCEEKGHKAYYGDISGLKYYSSREYTRPLGTIEEVRILKELGESDYFFNLSGDLLYYKDEEHEELIGAYKELAAWLDDLGEDGGALEVTGHEWEFEDVCAHKCAKCGLYELHTLTDGRCDICDHTAGYNVITKDTTELTSGIWVSVTNGLHLSDTLEIDGDVTVCLADGSSLFADGGIHVTGDDILTVYAHSDGALMGRLTATGGENYAAIGGAEGEDGGNIAIRGGIITATGIDGAAIGGGSLGGAGNIEIFGGVISANAENGAGIGTGSAGNGGKVTLYGGDVIANSSASALGAGKDATVDSLNIYEAFLIFAGESAKKRVKVDGYKGEKSVELRSTPAIFNTVSLTLSGELGMNFYVKVVNEEQCANAYMRFTSKDGETTDIPLSVAFYDGIKGKYRFTYYVNALEMADDITAEFIVDDDNTTKVQTSVEEYAQYIIENSKNEKSVNLARAILTYGHYAQTALAETHGFDIGDDGKYKEIADTGIIPDISADLSEYALCASGEDENIKSLSMSLALEEKTDIYIYVTADTKPAVTGMDVEIKKIDGRYRITIPNIAANELGDVYELNIGGIKLDISALSYAYSVLCSKTKSDNYKKTAAALYEYCLAAKSYAEQ